MDLQERLREGIALFDVRLFELGGTPVTVATLVIFLIIVLVTLGVSRVLRGVLERVARDRRVVDEGSIGVTSRLLHYAVLITGFAVALNTIGVNLTALFAAGAIFAVAIGFAMQNLTANFVSGVILLFERAVKPGDIVEVDGQMVRVTRMGIRATVARTLNEEDLIIPSSQLVQSTVKNFTLRDSIYRLGTTVGVTYESDMALVRKVLEETLDGLDWRSKKYEPAVLMREFGNSSVDFAISVWIADPWKRYRRLSDLHEAVWFALREAGVTIAFPQLDVHFDSPVTESIQSLKRAG
jgi:small-conductance mechanosensitive channel